MSNRTASQRAASRANGAKSCGPKTEQGRRISSRNALKHGLSSEAVRLSWESEEEFNNVRESYLERFDPADDVEADLVERMVAAAWRMRRVWALENAEMEQDEPDFERLAFLERQESRLARHHHRAMQDLLALRRQAAEDEDENDQKGKILEVRWVDPLWASTLEKENAQNKNVRNEPEPARQEPVSTQEHTTCELPDDDEDPSRTYTVLSGRSAAGPEASHVAR